MGLESILQQSPLYTQLSLLKSPYSNRKSMTSPDRIASSLPLHPPTYSACTSSPPPYTPYPSITPLGPGILNTESAPSIHCAAADLHGPHLRAVFRDYQASQNPQNWGRRRIGRYESAHQAEPECDRSWLAWCRYILELMTPDQPFPAGAAHQFSPCALW